MPLRYSVQGPVEAEVAGIREAMAFTANELFFTGPSGTRREPLKAVGPLRGTPTGEEGLRE